MYTHSSIDELSGAVVVAGMNSMLKYDPKRRDGSSTSSSAEGGMSMRVLNESSADQADWSTARYDDEPHKYYFNCCGISISVVRGSKLHYVFYAVNLIVVIIIVIIVLAAAGVFKKKSNGSSTSPAYMRWCVGNCNTDVSTSTLPGVVLMGGGTDVDAAFNWQITKANGGDFLILRADDSQEYNPYIYNLSAVLGKQLNSVSTIQFISREASNDTTVLTYIENAEAVFFAGGDQADYMGFWQGTPVQALLQKKLTTISVGGTSAGCAILGNWVYNSSYESPGEDSHNLLSHKSMVDPFNPQITIQESFLQIPFLDRIITDTHFVVRNRMGRMLTFIANLVNRENSLGVFGVGIDADTALLLDVATGVARIVGYNTVHICSGRRRPEIFSRGKPLTFSNVTCTRLYAPDSSTYDFGANTGTFVSQYCNNITHGHLNADHYGPPHRRSGVFILRLRLLVRRRRDDRGFVPVINEEGL